jgi:hypothetical protein
MKIGNGARSRACKVSTVQYQVYVRGGTYYSVHRESNNSQEHDHVRTTTSYY